MAAVQLAALGLWGQRIWYRYPFQRFGGRLTRHKHKVLDLLTRPNSYSSTPIYPWLEKGSSLPLIYNSSQLLATVNSPSQSISQLQHTNQVQLFGRNGTDSTCTRCWLRTSCVFGLQESQVIPRASQISVSTRRYMFVASGCSFYLDQMAPA